MKRDAVGAAKSRDDLRMERAVCTALGKPIELLARQVALVRIRRWAHGRASRYVSIGNEHSVIPARLRVAFPALRPAGSGSPPFRVSPKRKMPLRWHLSTPRVRDRYS